MLSEQLTEQFYAFERRVRGWEEYSEPISLEPAFIPFLGHSPFVPYQPVDDAAYHTLGSFLKASWHRLIGKRAPEPEPEISLEEFYTEQPFAPASDEPLVEFELIGQVPLSDLEAFYTMLGSTGHAFSIELIGQEEGLRIFLASPESVAGQVRGLAQSYLPDITLREHNKHLESLLNEPNPLYFAELALAAETHLPLRLADKQDTLTGLLGVVHQLQKEEIAGVQILFQSAVNPWAESLAQSIVTPQGKPFFQEAPQMVPLTKEKISQPLVFAAVRVFSQAPEHERGSQICSQLLRTLSTGTDRTGANRLTPMSSYGHELAYYQFLLVFRLSCRMGMLLNVSELTALAHVPERLQPITSQTTHLAPAFMLNHPYQLGINEHLGERQKVGLDLPVRLRHLHIVGATGSGKSTLLTNLILSDIKEGIGGIVIDPHGDLIDDVLSRVEINQEKMVVIDPSVEEYTIGLNLLSASSAAEKTQLASDLASSFRAQSTSWGDQMEVVLQNTISAFMESSRGGNLLDLREFLVNASFRKEFLTTVQDPLIVSFWEDEFPRKRSGSVSSILTRLQFFLRPRPIRAMVSQQEGISFSRLMDSGAMILVRLSQGLLGAENSYLLGTLLLTKVYQAALGRQTQHKSSRNPFFIYLDEFQNFITPTLEGILSGARKYGVGLVLAHQNLDQLFRQNASLGHSVMANAGTKICFQLSDDDAKRFGPSFAHFTSEDLVSLEVGQAVVRVLKRGDECNVRTIRPQVVPRELAESRIRTITALSNQKHAVRIEELSPKPAAEPISTPAPKEEKEENDPPQTNPKTTPQPKPQPTNDIEAEKEAFLEAHRKRKEASGHQLIQTKVKQLGETRGYKSTIEAPTPNGSGRVDVLLEHEDRTIAVEVGMTTSLEHEVKNITKCLAAGYLVVSLIPDEKRRESMKALIRSSIPKKEQARVQVHSLESFVEMLDALVIEPDEEVIKGYKVKVEYTDVSDEERERRRRRLNEILARRKKE